MYNGEYTNIGVVRTGGFILFLNFFLYDPLFMHRAVSGAIYAMHSENVPALQRKA